MSRALLVTGFGSGIRNAETIAEALSPGYFEEIDALTFSEALKNSDKVRKAAKGATAVTHSAGYMALMDSLHYRDRPKQVHALGAPLPSSAIGLVFRSIYKSGRMLTPGVGAYSMADIVSALRFHQSVVGEMAAHSPTNLGQLGKIAGFDAVKVSIVAAREQGVDISLGYNDGDAYFQLSAEEEGRAVAGGVAVHRLPGEHDEIILRPELAAATYFKEAG